MTFLELSSSSRASQEDNFRDDCFTPGDRVDIVPEFHRKAEDNIPMVRLRAPAAVRADQDQEPGLGADVCMNIHGSSPLLGTSRLFPETIWHIFTLEISTFLHCQCSHIYSDWMRTMKYVSWSYFSHVLTRIAILMCAK